MPGLRFLLFVVSVLLVWFLHGLVPDYTRLVGVLSTSWLLSSVLHRLLTEGVKATFGGFLRNTIASVPGASQAVTKAMDSEVTKSVKELASSEPKVPPLVPATIPQTGCKKVDIMNYLKALQTADIHPEQGTAFAYSYYVGDRGEHVNFIRDVYGLYIQTNGLNPIVFPSIKILENQVVAMTAKLFNGPASASGSMTSGGTESNLLAIKTYRDLALATKNIKHPEMIVPITAHPSIPKGGHLFGVKVVFVGVNPDTKRVDVDQIEKAINRNTILLVCSAPQFPHGCIDPVPKISDLALKWKIPLHVDSCIGGFVLPWVERLGNNITCWDFRNPGVTSISADIHKYGYSAKGASVILYREEHYRKYQYFAQSNWPGGLFVSPTLLGTRAGGGIAAAWASLVALGEEGFMQKTKIILETRNWLIDNLSAIPGIKILGKPESSLLAFTTTNCNVLAVADVMSTFKSSKSDTSAPAQNWKIECNVDSIHMSLMPPHWDIKEQFVADVKKAINEVIANPSLEKKGMAATYGMVSMVPDPNFVEEFLSLFLRKVYSVDAL